MENNKKLFNLLLRGWFKTKGRSSRQEYISRFMLFWVIGFIAMYLEKIDNSLVQTPFNIILMCAIIFIMFVVSVLSFVFQFRPKYRNLCFNLRLVRK